MKPEQLRIKIAEACGWKRTYSEDGRLWGYDPENGICCELPDYLNDLNAMHEAEKLLGTAEQQNSYCAEIAQITWGCEETGNRQVVFNQLAANAAQRAEAFRKTLKLGEDAE